MKTKTCTVCHKEKPLSEFNNQKKTKDGYQTKCRTCNQECSRKYYHANTEHVKNVVNTGKKRRRAKLRTKINAIKKNASCFFCGESEPICLDFHHVNPKDKLFLVSTAKIDYKWETIIQEINKCKVICANCHRKLHAGILQL